MKKFPALLILLSCCALGAPVPSAMAQAYRSQLKFLEDFAARQYERGNKDEAMKQFGWILRIEPDNAVARAYLQKMADTNEGEGTPRPERAREIIADISGAGQSLAAYEKNNAQLVQLIRNLITENDALYQALYKRSREVIEFREKFEGTPYGDAYANAMKDVPIDRVPQRLYRPEDILPPEFPAGSAADKTTPPAANIANNAGLAAASGSASKPEIDALLTDIAAMPASAGAQGNATTPEEIPDKPGLDAALSAKREAMIDRTITTAEKNNSLIELKEELLSINTGLKQTNNRYIEALQKIDEYYRKIKNDLARKNFTEQRMFSELVADYAEKLKEIEALKDATRQHDASLLSYRSTLDSTNDRLRQNDSAIAQTDAQLMRFQTLLTDFKKALDARDATIEQQKTTILSQETALGQRDNTLRQQEEKLRASEAALGEKDNALRQRNETLRQRETELSRQSEALRAAEARAQTATPSTATTPAPAASTTTTAATRPDTAVLDRQAADIALAKRKLDDVASQVSDIETSLKEGDRQLELLKKNIAETKTGVYPLTPPAPAAFTGQRTPTEMIAYIKALETRNNALAVLLAADERSMSQTSKRIVSLQDQLALLRDELAKAALPAAASQQQKLKERITALETRLAEKQKEVDAANSGINTLTVLEQVLKKRVKGVENLLKAINALTRDKAQLRDANARLQNAVNGLKETETRLQNDIVQGIARQKASEEKVLSLQVELSDLKGPNAKATALSVENNRLRQSVLDANEKITAQSRSISATAEDLKTFQETIRAKDARIAELSERLTVLQTEQRSLASARDINVPRQGGIVDELEGRLRRSMDKLTAAESAMTAATSETNRLREKLAANAATEKTLTNTLVSKDEQLSAMAAEIEKLKDSLKALTPLDPRQAVNSECLRQCAE